MFEAATRAELAMLDWEFDPKGAQRCGTDGQLSEAGPKTSVEPAPEVLATSPRYWPCIWQGDE